MGDGLIAEFKHSNSTSLCCYENFMDNQYFLYEFKHNDGYVLLSVVAQALLLLSPVCK
jgi:hypothetical protein